MDKIRKASITNYITKKETGKWHKLPPECLFSGGVSCTRCDWGFDKDISYKKFCPKCRAYMTEVIVKDGWV
jgi:hypothetical protein